MAPAPRPALTATCPCGQTSLELLGAPILSATCYCESCRTAGRQLEEAEGAPPVVRADGGVDYCLYRKDRVRVVTGGAHLSERRLAPASPTRRLVATCCHAPLVLDFTPGHWLSVYRDRIDGEVPAPEMAVNTEDAPEGTELPEGLPAHPRTPARFLLKLLGAWVAMGFRRPKLTW